MKKLHYNTNFSWIQPGLLNSTVDFNQLTVVPEFSGRYAVRDSCPGPILYQYI